MENPILSGREIRPRREIMSLRGPKSAAAFTAVLAVFACISGGVVCTAQAQRAQAQRAQPQSAPAQSIVGSWEVVESVRNSSPPQPMVGATLTFNADQTFSIDRPQRTSWTGMYRVDPRAGTLDLAFA